MADDQHDPGHVVDTRRAQPDETDAAGVEWSRNMFRSLSDGGTWGVPRSGQVFTKRGSELVLTERMPWDPAMPGTPAEFLAYQEDDYEVIKRHFEAAGVPVTQDLSHAVLLKQEQLHERGDMTDKAEIIEHLVDPEGPDEMAFVLRSGDPDPDRTFSLEGIQEIATQVHDFIGARVVGHKGRTGESPKNLRAIVKLDWIGPEDELLDQGPRPWYSLDDTGPTPFDGDVRAASSAFAARLKKERG